MSFQKKKRVASFRNRLASTFLGVCVGMVFLTPLSPQVRAQDGSGERRLAKISEQWKFFKGETAGAELRDFDDSLWASVAVPHTWNTDVVQNQTDDQHYQGVGWYRTEFNVDAGMVEKRLFLRFEGAMTVVDVFLNGKHVGRHEGGYTAFCFEISSLVSQGENTLAVKVDNSDNLNVVPSESKLFTRFGGIYRPVHLLVTNGACITPLDHGSSGVSIRQSDVSERSATVEITTKISSDPLNSAGLHLRTRIYDVDHNVVSQGTTKVDLTTGLSASVKQTFTVATPHLWNGRQDPYLYRVVVQLHDGQDMIDEVTQPLGLRYYDVDPKLGFSLNGKPMDLYGVSRHQEWEREGSALTDQHHQEDVKTILELGARAVRLAHYPQSETVYRLCDQTGLIVWAEIPVTPPYQVGNPKYLNNAEQQLIEMIRQLGNHPSIFFWGLYNEVDIPATDVQALYGLAKVEDATRLVTAASNKPLAKRHQLTDLIAWNKYPMWYSRREISQWYRQLKRSNPKLCVGVSEYGAGCCVDQHDQFPERPDPTLGRFYPEQYGSLAHEKIWADLQQCEGIWCKFVWNFADFSWPGVRRGNRINVNHKGLVTYDRKIKKDPFFFYQANWSERPVLHITSRRHRDRKAAVTPVKIYSNCQNVKVKINGKLLPETESEFCVLRWPEVKLQPGLNTIETVGTYKGAKVTDACQWIYSVEGSE